MKQVMFSKDALRTLRRIPSNVARTIRSKIDAYAADPASQAANVRALRGETGVLRLRVGDWRVLFTEDLVVIAVIRIAPRGSAYE